MYKPYDLNISGRRSISFMGEELAYVSNRETSEETKRLWDDVRIYRLDPDWAEEQYQKNRKRFGNKAKRLEPYRLGLAKCTRWEGSWDTYRVFYCRTLEQVRNIVRAQVPHLHRETEDQLRLSTAPPQEALEHDARTRNPVEP
jgi:hypothetical protein